MESKDLSGGGIGSGKIPNFRALLWTRTRATGQDFGVNEMQSQDELTTAVKRAFPPDVTEFHPCAFFDSSLDCIRVFTRDCSVTEERVNDWLTVLVDNYPTPGVSRFVGFTIKGVRHFCREYGLRRPSGPIRISALLDALIARSPDAVVEIVVNQFARPMIEKEKIDEIELTAAA